MYVPAAPRSAHPALPAFSRPPVYSTRAARAARNVPVDGEQEVRVVFGNLDLDNPPVAPVAPTRSCSSAVS